MDTRFEYFCGNVMWCAWVLLSPETGVRKGRRVCRMLPRKEFFDLRLVRQKFRPAIECNKIWV